MRQLFAAALIVLCAALGPAAAETPVLRVAVLKFGTVNWELETIKRAGLDTEHGFTLEIEALAGGAAAKVAFQGGAADSIVADWIWVARQRAAGHDYVFLPYSRAVGGIAVPGDSPIEALPDLAGKRIGIAGGPLDKSWLLLRAFAEHTNGLDLAAATEQVYGAPPLVMQQALDGGVDAAINYWPFLARMEASGFRVIAPVDEAAGSLGLDAKTPLLGYIFKGAFIRDKRALVEAFAAASRAAKRRLAGDDSAWEEIRPLMRAKTDAEFERLKAGFRAGIPSPDPVDPAAAAALFNLMARLGGRDLVGDAEEMPDGVFYEPRD